MNRRQRVEAVLRGGKPDRTPMGFWMHFPEEARFGDAAVKTHLKYFQETGTDLCKVMNENLYPVDSPIEKASDWGKVRACGKNDGFIRRQTEIVKKIADSLQGDAPVIATVHGVVASASHALMQGSRYDKVGRYALLYHLRTDPESVRAAFWAIAETLTVLAEECIAAGADGIYYAALGGERDGFTAEEHGEFLAPLEIALLREIQNVPLCNILHMCKPKAELKRFAEYPCQAVNWGILESGVSLSEGGKLFPGKVLMGGMDDRSPSLIGGTKEEVEGEVRRILEENAGQRFILASDCTLPSGLEWERIAWMKRACEKFSR